MADKRFLDHNPLSGLTTYTATEDGKEIIGYEQASENVQTSLDWAKHLRNDESYASKGIKNSLMHYAHIPDGVMLKMMMEDGINPYRKEDQKKMFQLLNTKYKLCKTTVKHHEVK